MFINICVFSVVITAIALSLYKSSRDVESAVEIFTKSITMLLVFIINFVIVCEFFDQYYPNPIIGASNSLFIGVIFIFVCGVVTITNLILKLSSELSKWVENTLVTNKMDDVGLSTPIHHSFATMQGG